MLYIRFDKLKVQKQAGIKIISTNNFIKQSINSSEIVETRFGFIKIKRLKNRIKKKGRGRRGECR